MRTKNTLAVLATFTILLLSLAFSSAATTSNITLSINQSAITNASVGNVYQIVAEIANLNGSAYNVTFGTTDWTWNESNVSVAHDTNYSFLGNLTIPSSKPATKQVIAKIYNETGLVFELKEDVSIAYYTAPSSDPESLCSLGDKGDLKISDLDVNNLGEGDDEEWEILDELEITIEIENTDKNDDVDDVYVELIIKDKNGNDVTSDFDLDDEEIDLGRIKDDDVEEAVFKIKEVPADIDEGSYYLYFKAYSDDDEDGQCVSTSKELNEDSYHKIKVIREDDPAVVVKTEALKILAACGDKNVEVSFDVVNLGSDKEDKVLITLENSALGIFEKHVVDNLRSGKKKEVSFFVDLPENLRKDKYDLEIKTYFDYDDDEDELETTSYDEDSDDIDRDFSARIEIIGCKGPEPGVGVNLVSEAPTVGEDLVVRMVVKNNDDDKANFVFTATGYESWAELVSVTPQTADVSSQKTKEVLVTLKPKTSGVKSFNIEAIVDGETYVQPVSVNVAEVEEPGLGEIDSVTMYLIIGIVALLLVILLVLIIKSLRRPKKVAY